MSLTPMVNVDPFDLTKYQKEAESDHEKPSNNDPEPASAVLAEVTVPSYTIRVLTDQNDAVISTPNTNGGIKTPLIEVVDHRNDIENINNVDNIVVYDQSDAVTNLSRRKNFFKDEKLQLDCEWDDCSDYFDNVTSFTAHVSKHVQEAEIRPLEPPHDDVFGCLWTDCGFETPSSEEMVRHINFHSFHTKIKCHGLNMLTKHGLAPCSLDPGQRNIVPDITEPWLCQWEGCDSGHTSYTQPRQFYLHVSEHAEEERTREGGGKVFKCRWGNCQSKTGTIPKLKEHLRSHTQEKMIGCPNCGALFSNRVKFLDHCKRQQVSSEDAFTCNNCGKKFALERLLRDHMRSHINHYKCPHCDMTCPTPSTLSSHIRYKHIEEKPFKCNFCDYTGKFQHDLKSHMKVHYEDVEMKCSEPGCEFKCRSQTTLRRHILKKHENSGKNYACHLCDKRYDRGAYLTKHLMKEHNFSWPNGHSRFRYIRDDATGIYRLQTIRFESLDLQDELQGGDSLRIADSDVESVRSVTPSEGMMFRTSSPVLMEAAGSVYSGYSTGSWSQRASSQRSQEEADESYLSTLLSSHEEAAQAYVVKFPVEL